MNIDTPVLTSAPVADPNFPLFSGWPFLKWLTETADKIRQSGDRFYGESAVHRAYDRGGIEAAVARCVEGATAALSLAMADGSNDLPTSTHLDFVSGWVSMRLALLELHDAGIKNAGLR